MSEANPYAPNPEVLERLQQVTLAAVVGATAVGKTTLIERAMELNPNIHVVLTTTSRTPRPGERDGVDYHFRPREEMARQMARGEFVQVAPRLFDDLYATLPEDYNTEGVSVMAVLAQGIDTFRALPFKAVRSIFVVPPSYEAWQGRIVQHRFTPQQLAVRMAEARHSFEFALADMATRCVINDNVERATQDFATLALGRPLSPRLQDDQERAHAIVRTILSQPQWPVAAADPQ